MEIFENAISAIQMALEDFATGKEDRLLSAVRNLHAGILLLYKAKLSELSPPGTDDVLIKKQIRFQKSVTGGIEFVGEGRKTVDVQDIKVRFKSLGVSTDWKRFDKINSLRNDIEHHFTTINADGMRGIISDTFDIIRKFIMDELGSDPKGELGDETWGVLLSVSEVFEQESDECKRRVSLVNWQSSALEDATADCTCHHCSSVLLVPVGVTREEGVECRSCSEQEGFEEFATRALSEHLGWQNHDAVKDGGDEVLITCPFCYQDGYVVEEGQCAICGESCPTTCDVCSSEIPTCELSDESVCSWCAHMASKDD